MKEGDHRPEFVITIEKVYYTFESEIDTLRFSPFKKTDIAFREVVISAYVKAYDFVRYICKFDNHQDAFFQLPMLRGICEDLIALSYLLSQSKERQNYLVVAKRFEELKRSTKAQKDFFAKFNKGQIVPGIIKDSDFEPMLNAYKSVGNNFEKSTFPNVYTMAEKTGLKDLYTFIYHATSKMVHFDIWALLAMGWGEMDKDKEQMAANFSYRHDCKHFYSFALFYSNYLFVQQTMKFRNFLSLPEKIESNLAEIEQVYRDVDWPELITFSQLNMEAPSLLIRAMFRTIQKE